MSSRPADLIGIDYGIKRVGIARADTEIKIATPLTIIGNDTNLVQNVVQLLHGRPVATIVIGNSKDLDGTPNPIAEEIHAFVKKLQEKLDIPIVFEDEFYTTKQAQRSVPAGVPVDGSAAALILQSYLDRNI